MESTTGSSDRVWDMIVIEDYTVTMTCRTAITGLFLYLHLCPSVKLYNLSCSFTFISFPISLNSDLSLFFIWCRMVTWAWTTFCLFSFVFIVLSVILRTPLWQNWYIHFVFKLFALVFFGAYLNLYIRSFSSMYFLKLSMSSSRYPFAIAIPLIVLRKWWASSEWVDGSCSATNKQRGNHFLCSVQTSSSSSQCRNIPPQ